MTLKEFFLILSIEYKLILYEILFARSRSYRYVHKV